MGAPAAGHRPVPVWRSRAVLGVLGLALVMRLAVFGVNHPFPPLEDDDSVYDTLAWNMVNGHGFSMSVEPPFEPMAARTPGYPAFLAAVYLVAGRTWDAVRLLQIALSVLTCALVYLIACRVLDRRHALWAAGMYAIWPAAAYYPSLLLTESIQALLIALSVYCAFRCTERPHAAGGSSCSALSLAGATMVRPDYQLLIVLFCGDPAAHICAAAARRRSRRAGGAVFFRVCSRRGWLATTPRSADTSGWRPEAGTRFSSHSSRPRAILVRSSTTF